MKRLKQKITYTLKSFLLVSALAAATFVHADDTEVFYSVNVSNNLLFVLDVSGSMKKQIVSVTTTTSSGTTTTSTGGTEKTFDFWDTDNDDDATQSWSTILTAGNQWNDSYDLDIETGVAVAMRFRRYSGDLIPEGATITNAYIQFYSADNDSVATDIDISIENTDYAWRYTSSHPKILSRPYLGSVQWQPAPWGTNDHGSAQRTPQLKDLIQPLVNTPGWGHPTYGNSIAFKFMSNGERDAYSRDASSSKRPRLIVKFNTGGATKTFVGSVREDEDDAEQDYWYSDDQKRYENKLEFNPTKVVATRFRLKDDSPDKLIPSDATITKAYLQFTSAGHYTDNTSIEVSIEDTGYAYNYDPGNPQIRNRNYYGLKTWNPQNWNSDGDKQDEQQTIDVTDLVQHVVDRNDWDNALAFMYNTISGERVAYARDEGNNEAPVLHIEYQDINGATSGTTTSGGTTTVTRIESRLKFMQEALREVLADAPNFNVGLMKYSGMNRDAYQNNSDNLRKHYVGGVVFPVKPIYSTVNDIISSTSGDNLPDPAAGITVRNYIPDVADAWVAKGGTPIVDALYEAALYFRGEKMHYGRERNTDENIASSGSHPSSYYGGAAISKVVENDGRSSIIKPNYISPIKSECQSNYIVLMSDGKPTYYYNNGSEDNEGPFARAMKGTNKSILASQIPSCLEGNEEAGNTGTQLVAGTCGREITQYLANNDQMPTAGRGGNPGVEGKQVVKTFSIGFAQGLEDGAEEYLRSLATVENGYYTAEDKAQLKTAFESIFQAVAEPSGTLASPGYSVNVKSGLEHEKDIYIPVFTRKNSSRWAGNLKKFRIVDVNGKRTIQSRTGNYAVDELGGFNDDDATGAIDYWSTTTNDNPDGVDVEKGGLANLLDPDHRNLYSNISCPTLDCDLTTAANTLTEDNTAISNADLSVDSNFLGHLGLGSSEQVAARKRLINFIRGWDKGLYDGSQPEGSRGLMRHHMGDMLHSEPLVITYAKGAANGVGKKQYIFAATNEGYLHVFNTADDKTLDADAGKEIFAFMPKELLKNIKPQFINAGTAEDHKYGIDGVLTYWHDDKNHNNEVDGNDRVYLYFGLRRGGRSFYAMDVTNINAPKLLWVNSKTEASSKTNNSLLHHMGQSWSAPYLAKIGLSNGTRKEVMIVSGGYDPDEDRDIPGTKKVNDATSAVTADEGNDIFIFDAKEGDLLWSLRGSLGDASVTNSIPGGVRILDVNRNGLIDRMYFADTGGNVWRLDLSEKIGSGTDMVSSLTKLASLSSTGVNARKFYNEPDVAQLNPNGKTIFAVSVGSGYRAHPKDRNIEDKFFVLKDESPYYPLANDYTPIDMNHLASVSISGTEGSLSVSTNGFDDEAKDKGWYVSFEPGSGEKVLATAVTFDGIITFTSLVPEILTSGVGIDPCEAPVTQGRLYALDILTGKAVLNLDDSTEADPKDSYDAYTTVAKGEIPGKPQLVFNAVETDEIQNADGDVTQETCQHPVDIRIGKKRSQATGYDACRLESVYWNDPKED